jgi:hypothetical protein
MAGVLNHRWGVPYLFGSMEPTAPFLLVSMTAFHDEANELMFDLGARRYLVQMKEPGGICGTGVD